jgi:hypothetical protein
MTGDKLDDFQSTPQGWAKRWQVELKNARQCLEKWHEQGAKINKRFRDERERKEDGDTRWNLFTSTVETKMATLYGQTPKVSVTRRFADAKDDVARVAATMLERLLNSDIEKDGDTFADAVQYALEDRLLPGLGAARVRYVAEFEEVPGTPAILAPDGVTELAPAVAPTQRKSYECAETDYTHWRDMLWSPARVWHEVRWLAFGADMSRQQLVERFGEDIGKRVPLNAAKHPEEDGTEKKATPWDRARVWEVWDKETRRVFWYVDGFSEVLDEKEDPLGLEGFWPCPRPLLANTTTSTMVPRPDFVLAQDFYDEIDLVSTRITLLERAIRVTGVYDKSSDAIRRLLTESGNNELYPVDNWAMHAERGGLRGVVDWMPLEQITAAMTSLRDYRRELVDALYQVTGMADIMRGASDPSETARAQGIKAKFGSVRLQRLQDEVARFASDVQRLKAQIIAKHYDVASIIAYSNIEMTPDKDLAVPAAELIKSKLADYRIEVKPEAVSLTDFAALKQERLEVLAGISSFLQTVAPLAQSLPNSLPFLLQILQWSLSGLKGSSGIETVIDQAIAAAQQMPAQGEGQQQPDPKLLAQQMKGQQELAKVQAESQARMAEIAAEVQADEARERNQMTYNVREAAIKQSISDASQAARPQNNPFGGGKP